MGNPIGAGVFAPGFVRSEISFLQQGHISSPVGTNKALSQGTRVIIFNF